MCCLEKGVSCMGFYTIEGSDSSGKKSVTELIVQQLRELGYKAVKLDFPQYGKDTSTLVKMYLNGDFGKKADDVNPYVASSFYAVDRVGSYLAEWKHLIEDPKTIIICDRYTGSNAIHQTTKLNSLDEQQSFLNWLFDFEITKMGLPQADKTYFLDMPPHKSIELMKMRANKFTNEEKKDIHEADNSFLNRSYETGKWVASQWSWDVIPCTKNDELLSLESISNKILEDILQRIKKGNPLCK